MNPIHYLWIIPTLILCYIIAGLMVITLCISRALRELGSFVSLLAYKFLDRYYP
jgi:hypothetical protein